MTKKCMLKCLVWGVVIAVGYLLFAEQKAFAEAVLKAEPSSVVMAPKGMVGVKILGSGFKAEDRVDIVFAEADKGKDVPVAFAEADATGAFETKMNMLSVLQGFFHFRFVNGKPTPDPNNPPLPPGKYILLARSWDSGLEAACKLVITAPPKK